MEIERINSYTDSRFPQEVLDQHGAFLVDGQPWAFRIASDHAAVVSASAIAPSALAVSRFIRSAGDLVVPVTVLDGALCTLDGHTRLYTAWQMGIRTAMAFDSPLEPEQKALFAGIVQEARRRGVFRVEDMALYSHEEQEEKWNGWCRDYFGEPQS